MRVKAIWRTPLAILALSAASESAHGAVEPFRDPTFTVGQPLAANVVTLYLSTTCSHCAAFARDVLPRIDKDLIQTGRVRLVIREMPTAPTALSATGFLLARCAGGARYWDVVQDLLRRQQDVLTAATFSDALAIEATVAGLDPPAVKACLSDAAEIDALNGRRQTGIEAGVDGTPTFEFDGHRLSPGTRLAGAVYEGGELSYPQFVEALVHFAAK